MDDTGDFPRQVPTPVGWVCQGCGKPIEDGDEGRITRWEGPSPKLAAYHRDCFEEATMMGIGG